MVDDTGNLPSRKTAIPDSRAERGKRRRKKLRRPLRIAYLSLCAIICAVALYSAYLYFKASNAIDKIAAPEIAGPAGNDRSGGNDAPASAASPADATKPVIPDDPNTITFMLAGIDRRENGGGSLNTDVLMIGALNTVTNEASLLSIPRDMKLVPDDLPSHKVNAYYAHFYSEDRDTAISRTREFYSKVFDFPIDYMAVINFDGLRKMVDAVGGLTIDVDMDMRYVDTADGTDIDLKKGKGQLLDGKRVLDFIRYRKSHDGSTPETGDIARNARQQQVLGKLMDKLASFKGVTQFGNVIDIIGNNVRTDIPQNVLWSWILDFGNMKPDHLDMIPLGTRWVNPYIVVDEDDWQAAFRKLRDIANIPEPDKSMETVSISVNRPKA